MISLNLYFKLIINKEIKELVNENSVMCVGDSITLYEKSIINFIHK